MSKDLIEKYPEMVPHTAFMIGCNKDPCPVAFLYDIKFQDFTRLVLI